MPKRKLFEEFKCIYCNDPSSLEELIGLTDNRFSPITGSDFGDLNFKITEFIIHNQNRICSLEEGLIDKGEHIFVCGLLSNIYADDDNNDCIIESAPIKMIGPLNEWWFSGFDGSSSLLIGIESLYSCYLLQNPHPSYQNMFEELNSKMFLTKFVIEVLQDNPDCDFDTLLSILKQRSQQQFNIPFFLSSIDFLINQIKSYDSCRDSDELHLSQTALFKLFNEIAGSNVLLNNFRFDKSIQNLSNQSLIISSVNTANSRQIFDQILDNIIKNSNSIHESSLYANVSNSKKFHVGCFIKFEMNDSFSFGKIISINENSTQKLFHINLYELGMNTLLGETISKNILFATKNCIYIDLPLSFEIIEVKLQASFMNGNEKEDNAFICSQIFDEENCVFESLPLNQISDTKNFPCFGCLSKKQKDYPAINYSIGDCVLLPCNNNSLKLPLFNYFNDNTSDANKYQTHDERIFPEKHRKKHLDPNKDNYELDDFAFRNYIIGYVQEILLDDENNYNLKLNIFYRPENIFEKYDDFIRCDLNVLFWSEKTHLVKTSYVDRKCQVIYSENVSYSLYNEEFFYFNQCYDPVLKKLYPPSDVLKSKFQTEVHEFEYKKTLKILDLFSGCGGLSFGFAPLASKLYAIEKEKSAAQTYKKNYNFAIVYNADANLILKMLTENKDEFTIQKLPSPGTIDLIIGGPPCQGFSEMNRFSSSEYSLFKRSSIGCYLNFIDLYKPKYFLFENVQNMINFGKSIIFKIVCSFLVYIGYQFRIALLQAGCYGLPQNRKRLFIFGAQTGLKIPKFPFPTHMFSANKSRTSFKINDKKFDPFKAHKGALRMITIEDAIGDLIQLNQDDYFLDIKREYKKDSEYSKCHYQKLLRNPTCNVVLDHYCKTISELNLERIQRIPCGFGSDWRDLPNIKIKLCNGKIIEKLDYSTKTDQRKNGLKQKNTLIPWCLAHTADKHNHWPGLYGRLSWKGFFQTIVTNPDPISTQGKIIHPDQHRIISIREMARSQGFPDTFIFHGTAADKYSQIGNAVPPILSIKLAQEVVKCMSKIEK